MSHEYHGMAVLPFLKITFRKSYIIKHTPKTNTEEATLQAIRFKTSTSSANEVNFRAIPCTLEIYALLLASLVILTQKAWPNVKVLLLHNICIICVELSSMEIHVTDSKDYHKYHLFDIHLHWQNSYCDNKIPYKFTTWTFKIKPNLTARTQIRIIWPLSSPLESVWSQQWPPHSDWQITAADLGRRKNTSERRSLWDEVRLSVNFFS